MTVHSRIKSFFFRLPYGSQLYYYLIRVPLDFFQGPIGLLVCLHEKKNKAFMIMPLYIGDIVYSMAFLNAYVHQKQKNIVILAEDNKSDLVRSYNVKDAEYRFMARSNRVWCLIQSMTRCNITRNIAYKFDIYSLNPYHIPNSKGNCLDILTSKLRLPLGTKPQYFKSGKDQVIAITEFYSIKDRVVILNPYSYSMPIDIDFFDMLSSSLKEKGYIPFTNVVAGQRALKDSIELSCSLHEFYSICDQVPYVISVRTGLMDMVVSTSAKKLVFYSERSGLGKFLRLYGMKAWGIDNITEYVFDNGENALKAVGDFLEI